jgi:RNA polymerase sigma-70 factor (ECF subfamily)
MPLNGFRINVGEHTEGDVCLEASRLAEQTQTKISLDEQVTDLFNTLSDSVFVYLVSVFGQGSAVDIDDVTQEAFIQLYKTLAKGQQIENQRFWLFRVAYNLAIDRLRTQQFITLLDDAQWKEIEGTLSDWGYNPEQRALKQEEFAQLNQALKRLSGQERECLHLRAEGFRYREIGEILGIATTTVNEFLRRAIKKLAPLREEK